MTTKEMIAVMQAFEDGKQIEYKYHGIENAPWEYVEKPEWNWYGCDYRVTHEPAKPRFREIVISTVDGVQVAGVTCLDEWMSASTFAGFRMSDGSLSAVPTCIRAYDKGSKVLDVIRATHVIVEEPNAS